MWKFETNGYTLHTKAELKYKYSSRAKISAFDISLFKQIESKKSS